MLTRTEIGNLLNYCPETGVFTWRESRTGSARRGTVAGSLNTSGHRQVQIRRKMYLAHRLAWLLTFGVWPSAEIDHINGNRDDNRLSNLRAATKQQNQQNRASHRAGRLPGCCFNKAASKWQAQVSVDGKSHHLGLYDTEQQAHEIYRQAVDILTNPRWRAAHGE